MTDFDNSPKPKTEVVQQATEVSPLAETSLSFTIDTETSADIHGVQIDVSIEGVTIVKFGKVTSEGGEQPDGSVKREILKSTPTDSENSAYFVTIVDTINGTSDIVPLGDTLAA